MEKNKKKYIYGVKDRRCGECGKLVIPTPQWLYKLEKNYKTIYYCSYKCYRKAGGDSDNQRRVYNAPTQR